MLFTLTYMKITVWGVKKISDKNITGERISAIILPQQRKQWLSVELNRWRSEKIHCYFFK